MLFAKVTNTTNGYPYDQEKAKSADPTRYYEVDYVSMGQSSTTVHIKELGPTNSVNLTFYKMHNKEFVEYNIYADPEYNPYLAWR